MPIPTGAKWSTESVKFIKCILGKIKVSMFLKIHLKIRMSTCNTRPGKCLFLPSGSRIWPIFGARSAATDGAATLG